VKLETQMESRALSNNKPIRVCVAGATGWTGQLLCKSIFASNQFSLAGAIARRDVGKDIGEVLGLGFKGVTVAKDLDGVDGPIDVQIDYTKPDSVKERSLSALKKGIRVVIGTSGLSAADFSEIELLARTRNLGVIAAGNFSITAALAKHFALFAARHLPSWEIIDYAHSGKIDAPSGTTRELAEQLAEVKANRFDVPIDQTVGHRDARGATIGGTQVHSLRLPSYAVSFETIFGLPNERLSIRHDSGSGADPYVSGTLLAAEKVMHITGLVRGLDKLLFTDLAPS
jgi:4-hydroxy-tetrahydrodipicolinate reductase